MRVQFSEPPNPIWIRMKSNTQAWVKLRRNIEEEVIQNPDEETYSTMYNCDEVEIVIPLSLANEQFIQNNFDALFDSGDPVGVGRTNAENAQQDEYLIDVDFRVSIIELGVAE